jgi:hypothetical protein
MINKLNEKLVACVLLLPVEPTTADESTANFAEHAPPKRNAAQ